MKSIRKILLSRFAFFALFAVNSVPAATVLIPLQTCGIAPAANRAVVLTPLQAAGGAAIPVMDRLQGVTDAGGNWSPVLLPGVYQADVRPAWGQVGVTEFFFYVDPTNAMQDAFTNLLTATNNTWPPAQFAYTAQASDARYLSQSQFQSASTNLNAASLGGIGAQYYASQLPLGTPMPVLWLSAETFANQTNYTPVTFWPDVSGNGNDFYATGTNDYFVNNYFPSIFSSGAINGNSPWGFVCTNFFKKYPTLNTNHGTFLFIMMNDVSDYNPSANNFAARFAGAGINSSGIDDGLMFDSYDLANSAIGGAFDLRNGNTGCYGFATNFNKSGTRLEQAWNKPGTSLEQGQNKAKQA